MGFPTRWMMEVCYENYLPGTKRSKAAGDAGEAEMVREWLVDCMKRGMEQFLRRVPVEVEAVVASDWSAAQD